MIATYKGRPATDLTRDELVEAYTWARKEIDKLRQWMRQDAEMEAEFEVARKEIARR